MISIKQKSDKLGAIASTLCLIHCVATPFIFIAQTCTTTHSVSVPYWYKFIDYFFLIISFFAVYHSAKTTTKKWISTALWISWSVLCFIIINEKTAWFSLIEELIYLPAISLIFLHLYNRKYCQCNTTNCCIDKE